MTDEEFKIGGVVVKKGERKRIMLPLPSLYNCLPVELPVHVIRGKHPGPTLCVTAAIHGDEINGVEIVRRLLKRKGFKSLHGTLIAVPVVNVYSFIFQERYLMDRRDLNRSFPGSSSGSLASRLAHLVTTKVMAHSDYHIDLHSGSLHRRNLPQVRVNGATEKELDLAKAFDAPVILLAKEREGSLRQSLSKNGKTALLYEAGEAHRFNEVSIRVGVRGILNVLQALDMVRPKKKRNLSEESNSFLAKSSYWMRSPYNGLFNTSKKLGDRVKKGEPVGYIGNPIENEEYVLTAPLSGIIIGLNMLPLVVEGAALFNLACFDEPGDVEDQIQEMQSEFEGLTYIDRELHIENL
jgi:predicted deacylase